MEREEWQRWSGRGAVMMELGDGAGGVVVMERG